MFIWYHKKFGGITEIEEESQDEWSLNGGMQKKSVLMVMEIKMGAVFIFGKSVLRSQSAVVSMGEKIEWDKRISELYQIPSYSCIWTDPKRKVGFNNPGRVGVSGA